MSLIKIPKPEERKPVTYDNEVAALIQRRRYQILVHSLIYYELDMNLVSDAQWAEWGAELVKLQKEHPKEAESVIFSEQFKDFDASTGYNLPFRDEQIVNIAYRLLSHQPSAAELPTERRRLNEQQNQRCGYRRHTPGIFRAAGAGGQGCGQPFPSTQSGKRPCRAGEQSPPGCQA